MDIMPKLVATAAAEFNAVMAIECLSPSSDNIMIKLVSTALENRKTMRYLRVFLYL